MDYDNTAQAAAFDPRAYVGGQVAASQLNARTDLGSLRSRLEELVERARQSGARLEDIGDRLFGSRPVSLANVGRGESPERAPASFEELIGQLSEAMSRIDASLNRL